MLKKGIELYWNQIHTKYAILVTKGMHTGWTVMNVPEVAYDRRIVGYVIEHLKIPGWQQSFQYNRRGAEGQVLAVNEMNPSAKELDDFLCSIGYEDMYLNPMAYVNVVWIDAGRKWRIRDGGECQDNLEFEDEVSWNCDTDIVSDAVTESASDFVNESCKSYCIRGKCSSDGCEFLNPDGTCTGVVYPTYPPQYGKCSFRNTTNKGE